MLGLGKLFGGAIFGKFFDSIGLGWMSRALALTVDIMSGNWVAAAQDVFNLVAQFTDNSWMERVASLQPLGEFDAGCFGDLLSEHTLDDWLGLSWRGEAHGLTRFFNAVSVARETMQNNALVTTNRLYAAANQQV